MRKHRDPMKLTIIEIFPEITPEEYARRIERFVDTLAKANDVEGYAGCRYFAEKDHVEVYVSKDST